MSMTFHEYYGELPKHLLTLYRKYNVSASDHDRMCNLGISWGDIVLLVETHSAANGYLCLPTYL